MAAAPPRTKATAIVDFIVIISAYSANPLARTSQFEFVQRPQFFPTNIAAAFLSFLNVHQPVRRDVRELAAARVKHRRGVAGVVPRAVERRQLLDGVERRLRCGHHEGRLRRDRTRPRHRERCAFDGAVLSRSSRA